MSEFLDQALEYAKLGLAVLPLKERGKTPLTEHGCKDATTDPDTIRAWWTKWPNANIGIATGAARGLAIIDLDRDHGNGVDGVENFDTWQESRGAFPDTWRVETGGGGVQLYFKTGLDVHNVQNDQPRDLLGVDLRGFNGYGIAPPSVHPNGRPYYWDLAPDEIPLAANDKLLGQLNSDLHPVKEKDQPGPVENIPQGSRNGTLTKLAGKLLKDGLTEPAITAALAAVNKEQCKPPLSDREVAGIAKSVSRYDRGPVQITETPQPTFTAYTVKEYLNEGQFEKDIAYFGKYKDRKTGFKNLDRYLTLYPGMGALGGSASLGKTTFAVNLCDNLAGADESILYFSLEQEAIELVTKSLARALAQRCFDAGVNPPVDNLDIKNGATCGRLEAVKKNYAGQAQRFNIIRCSFTTTAAEICDYIDHFVQATGKRPIVVIDYLQLISPPDGFKGDTREALDLAIKTFKTMQLKNELFLLLISNFNRSGYDSPVSYSDFKETGMIEYTCDYIFGLELTLLTKDEYYYTIGKKGGIVSTNEKQKSDMVKAALQKYPKEVTFTSLKNRNGRQSFSADFLYYTNYDYFVPAEKENVQDKEPTGSAWKEADVGTPSDGQMNLFDGMEAK